MSLPFVKMSGAGNDFVLMDNRAGAVGSGDYAALARRACRRRLGVGADGLILIEPASEVTDFTMRYFNADGSEGAQCGNGTRCAAVFAREIGAAGAEQRIGTPAGVVRADILGGEDPVVVRAEVARPGPLRRLRLGGLPGGDGDLFAVEVGVPHAVEVVSDLDAVEVERRGRAIRRHPEFPRGANANFILLARGEIRLRTFERGVEAETLACGTGATAAALVARAAHGWPAEIPVRTRSGETLAVALAPDPPRVLGPAARVFAGILP